MTRIYLSPPDMGTTDRDALVSAFDSGWVAPVGPEIADFEREVAVAAARTHAVALCSGTAALHLALLEVGAGPGDDVLVSTFTFAASANAVTYVGARPAFIDSDSSSWNMNPELLREELEIRARLGQLPRAVIVVDLYGSCADYSRIVPACEEFEVPIIEDAAEALGATWDGRPAGSFGRFGAFSFNGNKIITTGGGGMLVTDEAASANHARHLATQARDPLPHYEHSEIGFNYRLSNLLAAVGRAQLADLGRRVARRSEINRRYRDSFAGLPVGFMPESRGGVSTSWLTCITLDPVDTPCTPEVLRLAMAERDIEARPTWKPMHLQPVFRSAPSRIDGTSERLFATGLCLPSGSSLNDEEQAKVIEVVRRELDN